MMDPRVTSGKLRMGTNYECMRKGVGVGRNLPYDPSANGPYRPYDDRKFYCGTQANLPQGYFSFGNPSMCYRKGVGIGRKSRATDEQKRQQEYDTMTVTALRAEARRKKCVGYSKLRKQQLIEVLLLCDKPRTVHQLRKEVEKRGVYGYKKMNRKQLLRQLPLTILRDEAKRRGIVGFSRLSRQALLNAL